MKSESPGTGEWIWKQFTSLRLALLLMLVIIALSVLGILIPQEPTSPVPLGELYSSDTVFFLRKSGLADLFHSAWFTAATVLLILNLLATLVDRIPGALIEARKREIDPVNVPVARAKAPSGVAPAAAMKPYLDVRSTVAREEFRDIAKSFASARIGKLESLRDEGGFNELQLATRSGRWSALGSLAGHAGLVVLLVGLLYGQREGFHAELTLDEGKSANFLQLTRGSAPDWWSPVVRDGREVPGFFEPGFEVQAEKVSVSLRDDSDEIRSGSTWVKFTEKDHPSITREVAPNRPVDFEGLKFHQGEVSRSGRFGATLIISARDFRKKTPERVVKLNEGESAEVEGISYKVVEVREKIEELGAAAQIEASGSGHKAERFWVFQRYPGYDPVNRRKSPHRVMVYSVWPHHATTLRISRDPGAPLVALGAALLFFGLLLQAVSPRTRFWFIWNEGRVTFAGHSDRANVFEERFERLARDFLALVAKKDKTLKHAHPEIRHGAL